MDVKGLIEDQEIKLFMGIFGGLPLALALMFVLWRFELPLFMVFCTPGLVAIATAKFFERHLQVKSAIKFGLSGLLITITTISGYLIWLFSTT